MKNEKTTDKEVSSLKPVRFIYPVISLVILIVAMVYTVVFHDGGPQIPLVVGCVAAGAVAMIIGYRWNQIIEFMIKGVSQSIEALLILLLIGILVGVWIASGTVPSMVYYGLGILSAKFFLPAAVLICGIVSFAIGAWGTLGTVGIALMGIGVALGLPAPMVAGCIISGSYFGDAVSPLSDATNLCAAVVGRDVFAVVKIRIVPVLLSFGLAVVLYLVVGMVLSSEGGDVSASVEPLRQDLASVYNITPWCLIPMAVIIICILAKVPAIPSMIAGIITGIIVAMLAQGAALADLLMIGVDGNVSETDVELLDTLLTAGGTASMMNTISIIFIAMAFGGIMQRSGQMQALVAPIVNRIKAFSVMNGFTVICCVLMNIVLPDQYLGMSVPGQMLQEEYDKRGYSRVMLSTGMVGGAVSSALIPWNTCGIYCLTVLGISALQYATCAYFNLVCIAMIIIWGFFAARKLARKAAGDGILEETES